MNKKWTDITGKRERVSPEYVSTHDIKSYDSLFVSFDLENNGNFEAVEVVQFYVQDVAASITRPVKELKGFQKIFLKTGEAETVTCNVTPEDLKFYDNNLKYDWESGEFEIFIGGDSQKTISQKITWNK